MGLYRVFFRPRASARLAQLLRKLADKSLISLNFEIKWGTHPRWASGQPACAPLCLDNLLGQCRFFTFSMLRAILISPTIGPALSVQYQIRFIAPVPSAATRVEGQDVADAVGAFMASRLDSCLFVRPNNLAHAAEETAYFAVVEVEGAGPLVARHFFSGIERAGGTRAANPKERASLSEVEQSLGLSPGWLSEQDWSGEESADSAWERKFGKAGAQP